MAIPLGRPLPSASCDRPERRREGPPGIPASGMPAAPTWSCSRWGFPCRRRCRRRGALLPHRFTLAGRPVFRDGPAVYFLWHFPWGRPRRALPGTVPPWSPDFPPSARRRKAAIRPSGTRKSGSSRPACQSQKVKQAHGSMGFYGLYHLGSVWPCGIAPRQCASIIAANPSHGP
jgi:hypothetical protein